MFNINNRIIEKMTFAWPHFINIHKYIANSRNPDECFDEKVCITQKIDGSNFTIWIEKVFGEWTVKAFYGRKSTIWTPKCTNSYDKLSYGVGDLGKLPIAMKDFAIKVGTKLSVTNILITGEVFRDNPKFASWHPFGYATNIYPGKSDDTTTLQIQYLNQKTHELFVECSQNVSLTDFSKTLRESTQHCVFPPPLLFVGKLCDAIMSLNEQMHKLSPKFEGVFVIIEDKIIDSDKTTVDIYTEYDEMVGYKWKTGLYDEQPVIKKVDHIDFKKSESKTIYSMLVEIYNNRPSKKDKPKDTGEKTAISHSVPTTEGNEKMLITEIVKTFDHEITKQLPLHKIPKNKRDIITKQMIDIVKKEIINRYTESDASIPYSIDMMNKCVPNIVKSLVNKVPYSI